ncbi:hypothetical protein [Okeania sp. SIO2B3]|uniref:hypothetical protein n=1 Tax=Okeania sp. SIO2B3 TaxID=2607784 RepID=UPI0013BFCA06|nr:hypothetical protein [Okeania sp. SIO2B3]NET41628.1 hypothetical protein [Okeania sp. SIO2B3]
MLKSDVPELDKTSIILGIDAEIISRLDRDFVSEIGFEIVELSQYLSSFSAFITEARNKLAIEFELKYHFSDFQSIKENERQNSILIVEGECMYDYTEQNFSDISLRRETANWLEADGSLGRRGDVYLSVSACLLGNEEVQYKFREPL